MRAQWILAGLLSPLMLEACDRQQKAQEAPAEIRASTSPSEQRIQDLVSINEALVRYHEGNGAYPVSSGFQGYASSWGASLGADWIAGLQPTPLPRDPAMVETPESQYLYFSDGIDYKLIAHLTGDCEAGVERSGVRIDPVRRTEEGCWAYGFWSSGGERF
jgi:hypothetical protein